ncbi:MAG: hypothetical protein R3Y28_04515 [Candidatus Gastranaerophilales bacterium]
MKAKIDYLEDNLKRFLFHEYIKNSLDAPGAKFKHHDLKILINDDLISKKCFGVNIGSLTSYYEFVDGHATKIDGYIGYEDRVIMLWSYKFKVREVLQELLQCDIAEVQDIEMNEDLEAFEQSDLVEDDCSAVKSDDELVLIDELAENSQDDIDDADLPKADFTKTPQKINKIIFKGFEKTK